ncbi:hypothetical protein [Pedobacter sp. WC2423]|uniref:hypothetical protein n=1 Tax=Pedobacter sp. WC2423 TaxID=3234142 RepID=UPI003466BF52
MKFFLLIMTFCLLTVVSCKQKGETNTQNVPSKRIKQVYHDIKGKSYHSLALIPEQYRTPEQKLMIKSTNDVLLHGVVAENNHMVLKMTKEECMAKGMTEKDYNNLQTSIRDNNRFYDSTGIKKVDEIVNDMHRALRGEKANGVPLP